MFVLEVLDLLSESVSSLEKRRERGSGILKEILLRWMKFTLQNNCLVNIMDQDK